MLTLISEMCKSTSWFGLVWCTRATDIWQPVDGRYASTSKALIRNEFFNWLYDDENMKKWYGENSHITASEKLILVTHWDGNAHRKLTGSKYDSFAGECSKRQAALSAQMKVQTKKFNLRDCPTIKYCHQSHWTPTPLWHQHPHPQKYPKKDMIWFMMILKLTRKEEMLN